MRRIGGGIATVLAAALALAPTAAARAPGMNAALEGADAPSAELKTSATSTLPGGAVVNRFAQEVGGVPVVGAGAVVLDPIGGAPELLFDKTRRGLTAPGEATVSRVAAIATATGRATARHVSSRQVIVPGGGGTLAWEVTYITSKPADYRVEVDAATGEVLSRRNLIRSATGHAQVFDPNAVVAQGSYAGLKDKKDKDTALLTSLRTPVTLENIDDGQDCLNGEWVNVRYGNKGKDLCKSTLDWPNVTRHSNKFEALMAYFHVDSAQQYIQSLGLLPINEESQNVLVDAIPDDNSFYQPSADKITMGSGGVDDGEDADVFVHEYGHAVQDAQNKDAFRNGGNQTGAQGEGFGDYFAEAYSTETAGFDAEWSHCVMEWDATSYDDMAHNPPGICLRRTDVDNTWVEQQAFCGGNEIHCIGEVWSSALFELRTGLGDDGGGDSIMDTVILVSHQLLPPGPNFEEASQALLEADESEYFDGSDSAGPGDGLHCDAIRAELVQRLLLNPVTLCT